MADLILYTNPMSRGRIARWRMEELGEPYEVVNLEWGTTLKSPDFLAINPMGKVPTLKHGEAIVTEGAAICAYLADAFPQAKLKPAPGTEASAAYYRWLFFAAGPVEASVTDKSLGVTVPDDKKMMVGYGSHEAVVDALERAVDGRKFIAGGTFTAADVYVGSQIGWGLQFNSIESRPALVAYWDGLKDRPAHVRAGELDDAAMPKQA